MKTVKRGSGQLGATLVEYSILLGMLILIGLASVRALGTKVSTSFSTISSSIDNPPG